MLKTPTYDYHYWDLKYYYQIHVDRQTELGNTPLKYDQFIKRLKKMNLHDAIYTPRAYASYNRKPKTPIQDDIRRKAKLQEENVEIFPNYKVIPHHNLKFVEIQTPVEKPWLLSRFISLFK